MAGEQSLSRQPFHSGKNQEPGNPNQRHNRHGGFPTALRLQQLGVATEIIAQATGLNPQEIESLGD